MNNDRKVGGNIALVWGFHTEEMKYKGKPPEKVRVRFSATYRRENDGKWRILLTKAVLP